jgi:hypothetical protein
MSLYHRYACLCITCQSGHTYLTLAQAPPHIAEPFAQAHRQSQFPFLESMKVRLIVAIKRFFVDYRKSARICHPSSGPSPSF